MRRWMPRITFFFLPPFKKIWMQLLSPLLAKPLKIMHWPCAQRMFSLYTQQDTPKRKWRERIPSLTRVSIKTVMTALVRMIWETRCASDRLSNHTPQWQTNWKGRCSYKSPFLRPSLLHREGNLGRGVEPVLTGCLWESPFWSPEWIITYGPLNTLQVLLYHVAKECSNKLQQISGLSVGVLWCPPPAALYTPSNFSHVRVRDSNHISAPEYLCVTLDSPVWGLPKKWVIVKTRDRTIGLGLI